MGIFFALDITWDEAEQDEKVILYFKSNLSLFHDGHHIFSTFLTIDYKTRMIAFTSLDGDVSKSKLHDDKFCSSQFQILCYFSFQVSVSDSNAVPLNSALLAMFLYKKT